MRARPITRSPDRLALEALTPGEIVLLHETQTWTLVSLPRALEALAAAGWQTVPVGGHPGAAATMTVPGTRPPCAE